mmetsp:Transcript_29963/g.96062  ORF Transcript_29963/g.96062 Transcript_29963/m.96062 type:complete len:144 (-) Transcript_29963:285-716(-)
MSGHHHEGFIRTTSSGSNQSHAGSARRNSGIIASVYKNDEPVHHNHPPAAETFTRVPTDPGSGVRRTSSSGWNLPPEQEAIFERLSSVKDEMKGTIQETQRQPSGTLSLVPHFDAGFVRVWERRFLNISRNCCIFTPLSLTRS